MYAVNAARVNHTTNTRCNHIELDGVTMEFYNEAKKQGLAKPLTGFNDYRLRHPSILLKEGWKFTEDESGRYHYYLYEKNGKRIQLLTRIANEIDIIQTYMKTNKISLVEHVEEDSNGTRNYEIEKD